MLLVHLMMILWSIYGLWPHTLIRGPLNQLISILVAISQLVIYVDLGVPESLRKIGSVF
jgi:hypothetical protein